MTAAPLLLPSLPSRPSARIGSLRLAGLRRAHAFPRRTGRKKIPTSILCSLVLLISLAAPAFAQEGQALAAAAATASRQFKAYVDEVAQAGGRPDYTRPPASDFLRTIFDADQLASVPFNPNDKPWLLEWAQAAAAAFRAIAEFGVPPGQRIDAEQLRRNADDDAYGRAIAFNVRIQARLVAETEKFADPHAAGLGAARDGVAKIISDAVVAIGFTRPSGGRMIATALRDTDAAWLPFISAFSCGEILAHILKTRAAIQDRETIENLDALSTKIMASIGKT